MSLIPAVPSWRAQGASTFLKLSELAVSESLLPLGSESPEEQMAAARWREFRLISFLWLPGFIGDGRA